jgi:phage shock protein A
MTGDTHLRHIEDIDARALTYAEVKAIASGNPLVIEKASIDAEVTRLSRLQSQHAETQYRIRSSVRRLKEDIPIIARRIAAVESDLPRRVDTRGDAFEIKIGGMIYKDRGVAGELINRAAARIAGAAREQEIGVFAGFQVFVRSNWMGHVETVAKGSFQYSAHVSDTAIGTMRSLEYAVQNLEESLQRHRHELADSEKKCREFEAKVGEPFEHEAKLQSLAQRQSELEKALDITKNQAPDSLAADASEDNGENATNGDTTKIAQKRGTQTAPAVSISP